MPSGWKMAASYASHSRAADSTSVLSTICRSNVDRLMTLSTSAVAVCCCSDSRSSLSSRALSIAMTAWAAKFFTNSICLSLKGRTSWRYIAKTPAARSSRIIGTHSTVRAPPNFAIASSGCSVRISVTWTTFLVLATLVRVGDAESGRTGSLPAVQRMLPGRCTWRLAGTRHPQAIPDCQTPQRKFARHLPALH